MGREAPKPTFLQVHDVWSHLKRRFIIHMMLYSLYLLWSKRTPSDVMKPLCMQIINHKNIFNSNGRRKLFRIQQPYQDGHILLFVQPRVASVETEDAHLFDVHDLVYILMRAVCELRGRGARRVSIISNRYSWLDSCKKTLEKITFGG